MRRTLLANEEARLRALGWTKPADKKIAGPGPRKPRAKSKLVMKTRELKAY